MDRETDLLPVNYMHVVFTLPDRLNNLFLHHQVDCYNILFRVANQVMTGFAANPEFLDARMGYTAILHTWGQIFNIIPTCIWLSLLVALHVTTNGNHLKETDRSSFLLIN